MVITCNCRIYMYFQAYLAFYPETRFETIFENTVDPDQLASDEAS